jgi:hypothetical protein
MKQTVWLIMDNCLEVIRAAFTSYENALDYFNNLKLESDFDCYELKEIELNDNQ